MASVGVTARYTSVALHAVAAEAGAQKQESAAWSGRGGVASGGGSRASASSTAAEGVQRTGNHGQSVPKLEPFNQSRLSRLLRQPSLLEKAAHALAGMLPPPQTSHAVPPRESQLA